MPAGILASIPLLESGILNGEHAVILLAMIMVTASPEKYVRLASAGGADDRTLNLCIGLTVLCSVIARLIARAIMFFI